MYAYREMVLGISQVAYVATVAVYLQKIECT